LLLLAAGAWQRSSSRRQQWPPPAIFCSLACPRCDHSFIQQPWLSNQYFFAAAIASYHFGILPTIGTTLSAIVPALSLQVHQPAHKLADILQQLLQQQAAAAAVLLLEHLVSGQHSELAAAACRSAELDRAAAGLASTSSSSWLLSADPLGPRLLVLLLAGNGSASLLSQASQAAMLGQLLEQLHIAAAAVGGHDIGELAAVAAAPAVLQVLQGALLSPALDASSGEVQSLRLQLLAAALNLLLCDAAAEAAPEGAAEESDSEHGASSFADESEAESLEVQQQPGAAAVAARQLWQQQQGGIATLVERAPAEQQAAFVGSIQNSISEVLGQQATPGAAEAAAEVAGLALAVLGPSRQQKPLLHGLLQQRQAAQEGEAGSSSAAGSSSSSGRYSTAHAVFLAAVGAAAGYGTLLPRNSPQAASEAAVDIIAGLTDVPTAASVQQRQQLLRYVADTAADILLQPALQAAAAAAAAASPDHAAVLSLLLHTAVDSHSSASQAAVASFFAAATAGGSGQPQLAPALLLQVLPIAAPVFRSSEPLLQQSGLAELSQRLCQQCTAAEPAALATTTEQQQRAVHLLRVAVACFPCATGADAAAALPSPAAATAAGQQPTAASSSSSSSSYRKGDAVWYCQQGGSWFEAEVGPTAGLLLLASASKAPGHATAFVWTSYPAAVC
jgi:hypothetical protein